MSYQQIVDKLDPSTISKLNTAVELGRWENGDKLTEKQRANAMQAVMLWNANQNNNLVTEPFKVNSQGQFKIGKGAVLSDTPIEHKESFKNIDNLILRSKDQMYKV